MNIAVFTSLTRRLAAATLRECVGRIDRFVHCVFFIQKPILLLLRSSPRAHQGYSYTLRHQKANCYQRIIDVKLLFVYLTVPLLCPAPRVGGIKR